MSCAFCTDLASTGTLVSEDADTWVLLHPDWSPRGHVMVVAKRHVENASQLTETEWLRVARVWRDVERGVLAATGAQRAIVMKLGLQTPHLHLHLYPVSGEATRSDVFAAIEGKAAAAPDDAFVASLREHLTHPPC